MFYDDITQEKLFINFKNLVLMSWQPFKNK